jgi:fucose permease
MPPFILSCFTYLAAALPGSTIGMLWPSMRVSVREPLSALAILLIAGVAAQVVSSAATGRVRARVRQGTLVAAGVALMAAALAMESAATALWLLVVGSAVFSTGFGFVNAALNVFAAARFGPRNITWMHASYGLGATIGPLLVTALLAGGAGWRVAVASMSAALAAVALVLALTRGRWEEPAREPKGAPPDDRAGMKQSLIATREEGGVKRPEARGKARRVWITAATFIAVESGVETAAGIWGYVFLTSGRGVPATVAGVAVSAYWAMMFAGRALLGPVAERAGASRVLAIAIAAVPAGALLMALPGPAAVPVAGMMLLGLAAAPVFPLLTLTTADRVGAGGAAMAVGLQTAASAIGSAALPSAIGLVIGAAGARATGPALLVLGLAMALVYGLALRPAGAADTVRT